MKIRFPAGIRTPRSKVVGQWVLALLVVAAAVVPMRVTAASSRPPGPGAASSRPPGPNPYVAFLPADVKPDYSAWNRYLSAQAKSVRAAKAAPAASLGVSEAEPNDDASSANLISNFGTLDGDHFEVDVSGEISDSSDVDFFAFELRAGDIFGANLLGIPGEIVFADPSGVTRVGSSQDVSYIIPGPLPGGGTASLAYVVDTDGRYTIRVRSAGGVPGYSLELRLFRPVLETSDSSHQILFLDFDGATFDASVFERPVTVTTSPLASFLSGWGLGTGDEDAVIDAIIDSVAESLSADLRVRGLNGDYDATRTLGPFDIEILNSRDHLDPFGEPNVSRVIVGGTIGELGISTIGIAESIDVGNFVLGETAIVLLDSLSDAGFSSVSLNQYGVAGGATKVDLVGTGVGNIVVHEAGHFFANFHTDQFNASPNLMDQGGNMDNTIGVGPDRIFGTADDVDVDLGRDEFVPDEGFTGVEDTLNAVAFGLSTSAARPLDPFVFYRVREDRQSEFERVGPLAMDDGLGQRPWNLVRPTALGMPVDINGAGINDVRTSLTTYAIRPGYERSRNNSVDGVRILNDCNDLYLDITKTADFLVPSLQDPAGPLAPPERGQHSLDHFLCHSTKISRTKPDGTRASAFPRGIQVDASDGFQTRRYDLKTITKLCSPTETSGVPFFLSGDDRGDPFPIDHATIRNPADHLVCYRARRARRYILQDGCGPSSPLLTGRIEPRQPKHASVQDLYVANEFGDQVVDTKWEVELCLPSAKDPFCGDGFVEPRLDEQCDDGNIVDEDGCDSDCVPEFCGDGIVQPGLGEECEEGQSAACFSECLANCQCPPDRCGEAVIIPAVGGRISSQLVPGPSMTTSGCGGAGPETVFAWTPDRAGLAEVDTCRSVGGIGNLPIDTVLSIRDSTCDDRNAEVACNDQACFDGSLVRFPVQAGRTYFIVVDGWTSSTVGQFILNVVPPTRVYGSAARAFLVSSGGLLD